jgi:hypothetical protein
VDLLFEHRGGGEWRASVRDGRRVLELASVQAAGRQLEVRVQPNDLLDVLAQLHPRGGPVVLECLCEVAEAELTLVAVKQRVDKDSPNNLRTVLATVCNVIEAVGVEELVAAARRQKDVAGLQTADGRP